MLGRQWYTAIKALEYGAEIHVGFRKDRVTPEFEHQIRIAHYLRTIHTSLLWPQETVASALLHDVVEDHPVPLDAIYKMFGDRIGASVDLLTKTKGKSNTEYYAAMATDPIASVCKGADRIHNVQTMVGVFSPEKQTNYCDEVEEYILPMLRIARRQFPQQEPAYENIKHVLMSQVELVRALHQPPTQPF